MLSLGISYLIFRTVILEKHSNTVQEQVQFRLLTEIKMYKSSCCGLQGPQMTWCTCFISEVTSKDLPWYSGPMQKLQCLCYTGTKGQLEGGAFSGGILLATCALDWLYGLAPVRSYNKTAQLAETISKTNCTHLNVLLLGSDKCWSSELGSAVLRNTDFFSAY